MFKFPSAALLLSFLLVAQPAQAQLDEQTQLKRYVLGNTLTTLFHELGHGLVTEFELPVLGREEDAVDTFSVVALSEITFDDATTDDEAEEIDYYLWATIDAWLAMAEAGEDEERDDYDYAAEHSLDIQRFHSHLCLVYGSAPDYWEDLSELFEVEEDILEDCEETYEIAAANWDDMLATYGAWRDEAAAANNSVTVEIKRAPKRFRQEQEWVEQWAWLPKFESYIESNFDLPNPIKVRFESCGESNAFWHPEDRLVSVCYELMGEHAALFPTEE